jgi:hypothetical protein
LQAVRYAVWQHGAAADRLAETQANWTVEELAQWLGRIPSTREVSLHFFG